MINPSRPSFRKGSTLVEIVITVGILVTALVPLLGLLSVAIDTSGTASSRTVGARIGGEIIGELQQANWADLENWDGEDFYYDDQGLRLPESGSMEKAVYTARAAIPTVGVTMTPGAAPENTTTRQVVVLVASAQGERGKTVLDEAYKALEDKKPLPRFVQVSRALLVNMEKISTP
jgi:uncharacterized protein (TIGR02598 family)